MIANIYFLNIYYFFSAYFLIEKSPVQIKLINKLNDFTNFINKNEYVDIIWQLDYPMNEWYRFNILLFCFNL